MILNATEHRAEWLAARRKGITATDAAAIVGLHPYKTALAVWHDKISEDADDDLSDVEKVEWGNRLEPVVAEKFASRHAEYDVLPSPGLITGPEDWMLCTPDRLLKPPSERGNVGVLEIKTAGHRQLRRWDDDETPDEYVIQVMWQMLCTDANVGWIGALCAGQQYIEREFTRDDELLKMLVSKCREFREKHVLTGDPPIADPWRDAGLLAHVYQVDRGSMTDLSSDSRLALQHLEQLKVQAKEIKEQMAECEATIKQDLGEHEIGLIDDEPVVTWKQSSRSGYTVKPTTVRTLRPVNRKDPSE